MKKVILLTLVALFALSVQAVQAVPVLYLSDDGGANYTTIIDNTATDLNNAVGAVTFSGAIGNWSINVTTGVTKPALGSAASPILDLNSINVTSSAGGSLLIWFSEDGFNTFNGILQSSAGGVTSGTVNFATWVDLSRVSTLGPFGPGAFSGTTSVAASFSSSDKLWAFASIDHAGAGNTSFNYEVKGVPEPGTLLLLGSGLAGLGIFARRRKA